MTEDNSYSVHGEHALSFPALGTQIYKKYLIVLQCMPKFLIGTQTYTMGDVLLLEGAAYVHTVLLTNILTRSS